jgi:ubiquinone/menaquinone biosynthesis C-methylase UbiE
MSTDAGIVSQPCTGGWRAQFAHPCGTLGWFVGQLMAFKNRERSEWVLSRLNLDEEDRVLEVGFGPGVDIKRAAERAGYVTGVDPSDVMLRLAGRRNAGAVAAGRVDLRGGAMPRLPFDAATFDKAFSINSYQFWPDKLESVRELKRVMKPDGRVAVAVQPRNAGATESTVRDVGRDMAATLEAAGFSDVQAVYKRMRPVSTACVTAKA